MGYDADHAMARGEVGRVGVSVGSLEDMERLFDGIPLDSVSTSMTINATASILLCLYLALAKKQGVPFNQLRGTIQNDVLKEYIARGTFIFPPQPSMRIVTDIIRYCSEHVPKWNPISISGYHIREAGSSAVQEVAFTLSNALAYSKAVTDTGMSFDNFGGQLSFFFAAHNNLVEEIAKFRAARRLWAKLTRDRLGAKVGRSSMLRFHVQTGGSTLTAQQPNNNIVRVTLQALAAVMGGCQSLHTNSKDEALALPTEESATLALRTQQILAEESGVANTVDPFGGSDVIEEATDRIEEEAEALMNDIDKMGGSVKAIERGFFQRAIAESAYQYQRRIESKEQTIVGLNAYQTEEAHTPPTLRVDPQLETRMQENLTQLRHRRDSRKATQALGRLGGAAQATDENIVPFILDAVESLATLGEISDTLRGVFGKYQPSNEI